MKLSKRVLGQNDLTEDIDFVLKRLREEKEFEKQPQLNVDWNIVKDQGDFIVRGIKLLSGYNETLEEEISNSINKKKFSPRLKWALEKSADISDTLADLIRNLLENIVEAEKA